LREERLDEGNQRIRAGQANATKDRRSGQMMEYNMGTAIN
jgi:hypothetical protein